MSEALLLGLLITIEPLPVIGFILVLSTDGGARNGAAFIAGWVACLLAIVAGTLLITGGEPIVSGATPGTAALVVQVLVGLALIGLAVRRRLHPPPTDRPQPGWMRRLDRLGLGGAALLGAALQPWPLVAAGAVDISKADLSGPATATALLLFGLLATGSLLTMEIYTITTPEPAEAALGRLRGWIERHRDNAITGLAALAGFWLVVQGTITLLTQG